MTQETIARVSTELISDYEDASEAREGQAVFVRLPKVFLPDGCKPAMTSALVVLDPNQPMPKLLIKASPTLPNGHAPRNVSPEGAVGEGWFTFSFNQPWDENKHTAIQFVEGRLRRFAKNE